MALYHSFIWLSNIPIYGCESWTIKKAEHWKIDALELCWRRLLKVPWTARRSTLNIHWKFWCCSWSSNTLATWCEELTHWKRPWCWKDWRQEEKGTAEDEMIGWHHRLDGHEFEQAPEVGDRQGSLVCCSPWGRSWTQLNDWTELAAYNVLNICFCMVMHTESGVSDYSFFISL